MKNFLFLIFATIVLVFNHSWLPGMFMDGGIYATLGMNAALKGHWLVPHFSSTAFQTFAEHPPFFFIFEGVLFKLFGVSWTVARLSSLIFNLATISILWVLLKRFKNEFFAYSTLVILLLTIPYLKQSRFPNLDVPLTFFISSSILFYYAAFLWKKRRDWILTGIFFGLALLVKGHPAFVVPAIIIVHLCATKSLSHLKDAAPWYSFALGLMIFLIWPLSLKIFHGNIEPFQFWFKRQFIDTFIGSRGGRTSHFFVYFKVLRTYCLPWVLLSIWGIRKHRKDPLFQLALVWLLLIIVPLSFVGWKLPHYILPLYPALAILAAFGLESLPLKEKFYFYSKVLILGVTVVLLCLPVSNRIRRDNKIHYALETFETFKTKPSAFGLVGNPGYFWSFAPAVTFPHGYTPHRLNSADLKKFFLKGLLKGEKGWAFLVTKKSYEELKTMKGFKRVQRVIDYGRSYYLLAEKKLLNETSLYPSTRR